MVYIKKYKVFETELKGTNINTKDLALWLQKWVKKNLKLTTTDIRFIGSRVPSWGEKPRPDSDIDAVVFIRDLPEKDTKNVDVEYKGFRVEIHLQPGYDDGWQPSWMRDAQNELFETREKTKKAYTYGTP